MTVFVSSNVVLEVDGANGNNGVIGYDQRATLLNISSTTEDADFPVTNLVNHSTISIWKSTETASDEYITWTLNTTEDIDYVAVANHNFGSGAITISVETQVTDGGPWGEVSSEVLLTQDGPVIFRFDPQAVYGVRLRMQPTGTAPQAAVMYVGKLLVLQRRTYVGHTPIPYGRNTDISNGRSENGHFLGRVVLREKLNTSVSLQNLFPSWYRTHMEPFIIAAREVPFFYNWRPQDYPLETGFCWLTADAQPSNQRPNGMMQIDLQMSGVSL